MSDNRAGGRTVLNWRGPLLAGAIFASAFAVLLIIAHQNESSTTDAGSSFRQDPYGTSLLFDAYQRAGYHVERSQDENSLSDQNAAQTAAFFIGDPSVGDVGVENGQAVDVGAKFRDRVENFLSRGGRAVLVEANDAAAFQSSQGWEIRTESRQGSPPSGPVWAVATGSAIPDGSEKMYLANDSPWLKIDRQWTPLYAGPEDAVQGSPVDASANGEAPGHVYMAMRPVGGGELIVASQESFLLNEPIKTHMNPMLLDFLAGGRSTIWVDETLHGLRQDEGVLWLVRRYRLQSALLLFWATLLALLWSMSGDLVRHAARDSNAEVLRYGEHAGVAAQRLLRRSLTNDQILSECWEHFRHRSGPEAQAISLGPRTGPRLRAAFSMPPVAGYKELRDLIDEYRASAKGLARTNRNAHQDLPGSTKTISEEVSTP